MRQHRPHQKYSFPDYDNDLSLWIDEQQVKRFSGKIQRKKQTIEQNLRIAWSLITLISFDRLLYENLRHWQWQGVAAFKKSKS